MNEIAIAQFLYGLGLGLGCWLLVYLVNRAWLGFWSYLR